MEGVIERRIGGKTRAEEGSTPVLVVTAGFAREREHGAAVMVLVLLLCVPNDLLCTRVSLVLIREDGSNQRM